METALMSHFGRKAAMVAVAFATVGSAVFGGAALAGGGWGGDEVDFTGGAGGEGGDSNLTFCPSLVNTAALPTQSLFGGNAGNSCDLNAGGGAGAPGIG
jgi:hypothetical protein